MSRFNIYIIKEILLNFSLLVTLITGILWLGQGLRHIDLLTTDNISFISYLSYIANALPHCFIVYNQRILGHLTHRARVSLACQQREEQGSIKNIFLTWALSARFRRFWY